MDSDSGHQVVLGLHLPNLLVPRLRKPASVLLGKRFISGRSSVEGGPGCKQRLLYEVTVSGLKAIQADFFQGSYQLGQCRAKLQFVFAHLLARVWACVSATSVCEVVAPGPHFSSANARQLKKHQRFRS